MKALAFVLPMIALAVPAFADLSSGSASGTIIVVAAPEPRTVAISLTVPADYVSVPVHVTSQEKDTATSYENTREAIATITQKADESGIFKVQTGVAELTQRRKGFGISSGSWAQPAAGADLYVLVPLSEDRDDIFAAGADAARFLDSIVLPEKIECELGNLQLAVENPEQYRSKLLKRMVQQLTDTIGATGDAFGRNVKLEGLESPVYVRQVNDKEVEVFLNYSLTMSSAG